MSTLRTALLGLVAALSIGGGIAGGDPALAGNRAPPAVLTRTVMRGETIGLADVRDSDPGASVPGGDAASALPGDAVIGMEATRLLASGNLIHRGDVAPPPLVRRGETVAVSFDTGRLNIATEGRALASGGAGETVRVFIPATNRTLDATVAARGAVRLALP